MRRRNRRSRNDRPWWLPGESYYLEAEPEPTVREEDEIVLVPWTRNGIQTVQAVVKKKGTPR